MTTARKKAPEKKRSLFAELEQAMGDVKAHRKGRLTLRERTVHPLALPKVDGDFIVETREARGMSRAVFAMKLGLNPRSLEGWEQGKSEPPAPVAALILLAAKFPDTIERLASLEQIAPRE
ncbi:MAG TPA: helix-turn-helix domain-containing protein [Thermoleophilia bacterium]|nr:helix-turn-helix domain-containing protein [Thermoleophilia bacterium]